MNRTLKIDCNKFSKEINVITGTRILEATIPAGTIVDITFPLRPKSDIYGSAALYTNEADHDPTVMILSANGITVRCRASNWNRYFKTNGKVPTEKTLMNWMEDGICKSLGGNQVEPDGWSFDGTPSWLLALSLI